MPSLKVVIAVKVPPVRVEVILSLTASLVVAEKIARNRLRKTQHHTFIQLVVEIAFLSVVQVVDDIPFVGFALHRIDRGTFRVVLAGRVGPNAHHSALAGRFTLKFGAVLDRQQVVFTLSSNRVSRINARKYLPTISVVLGTARLVNLTIFVIVIDVASVRIKVGEFGPQTIPTDHIIQLRN